MGQTETHPKRLGTWRFHAPGTVGTIYMTGKTEQDAIESLARVRGDTVIEDQTLFEGKGGWVLQNKSSGRATFITHGNPM